MHFAYALFLDFDGTLVEIAERPDAVVVDPALPALLQTLSGRLDGALAVVSGRAIAVLDGFLHPARPAAAGLHGLERRIGGSVISCRPEDHPRLRDAVERLKRDAPARLLVEDKGCSVALHWREAPDLADTAAGLIAGIASGLGEGYRVQEGKAVLEILPADAGKGGAIRAFLREPPFAGRTPIFAGDDRTDEDGFHAVEAAGGIAIKVGPGPSAASRRLADPASLRRWLAGWADGRADPASLPAP
jgi:trehalose 6-phosphate phosphatase